jgi:hypothetical protein
MNDIANANSTPRHPRVWQPKYAIPEGVDVVELDRGYDLNDAATNYATIPAYDRDQFNNGNTEAGDFLLSECAVAKDTTTGLHNTSQSFVVSPEPWLVFHKPVDLDTYSQGGIWILGKHSYHATNQYLLLGIVRAGNVDDVDYNENEFGSLLHVQTSQYSATQMKVSALSHLEEANSRTNYTLTLPYNNARCIGILVNFTKDGNGNISANVQARYTGNANSGVSGSITNTTLLHEATVSLGTTEDGALFYPFVCLQGSSTHDQHRLLVVRVMNNGHLALA